MNGVVINAGIKIIIALVFSGVLIRKNIYREEMKLFIILFIIGQILGYGLGVEVLKIVLPIPNGTVTQLITSTIFPFILAFTIYDFKNREEGFSSGFYIRMMFLILIGIGFLQFLPMPAILTNLLLVIAFGSGILGLYQKYKKE